ncbi:MAG: hypothetical protein NC211_03860 [Alistipes senegalensis]|nr:hypothetical protein [Oxalobacter formigenes]MCM1280953.1 hypothetical protein [Alistipes senegalensis]
MLNNLPNNPDVAHALLQQKLNEHTTALREVREENEKQNGRLQSIETKVDRIEKNTASIVEATSGLRFIGKAIGWIGGLAGALSAIWYAITSWPNQGG